MENSKHIQKAGGNSNQFQIENVTFVNGITEQRAKEIFDEMYARTCKEYTQEAYEKAFARVSSFENHLMERVVRVEGAMEAFREPAFQFLLRSAQKTAAATEREADYELLSELLMRRTKSQKDRKTNAGISRAVEIVDQIDDDALCALTVAYATLVITPLSGSCTNGLNTLNNMFEKLIYTTLPEASEWISHLDLLDAVRINPISRLINMDNIFKSRLDGYICAGIPIDSENHSRAKEELGKVGINPVLLVENELLPGYVRIPVVSKNEICNLRFQTASGNEVVMHDNGEIIQTLERVWDLYSTDIKLINTVNEEFRRKWLDYDSLHKVYDWWNSIPIAFTVTQVGIVLACANAKKYDNTFPDL